MLFDPYFLSEFLGIIYGDGNLWTNYRKYEISFTCSIYDEDYFSYVMKNVFICFNKKPYCRTRHSALRLSIYDKRLFHYLVSLGVAWGSKKASCKIPQFLFTDDRFFILFVRGVFDTDGSVFTSDKKGAVSYPSLEITNQNFSLIVDIYLFLIKYGFRVCFRKSNSQTYKIAIHGTLMIYKWYFLFGSSHPRKFAKMQSIIKSFC